jgi:hypothetical protein
MAAEDKGRYEEEMKTYVPPDLAELAAAAEQDSNAPKKKGPKKGSKQDPNKPKVCCLLSAASCLLSAVCHLLSYLLCLVSVVYFLLFAIFYLVSCVCYLVSLFPTN